jgi:ParB-like chromosome segregation protein Spo0J
VPRVPSEETSTIAVAPAELGEALSAVRLCAPEAQQEMQLSLARLGQLTPVQVYRAGKGLELFDGFKRVRAARELSWRAVRAEVHALDAAGAKVRLLRCNAGAGLSEIEEAWLVRSLYRDDALTQPQIAVLLGRHKSFVCRRLTLAEGLSDGITASVRLGLLSATAAVELGRLQRCNQDAAAQAVARRGMTTRQTARLVDALLAAPAAEWDRLLAQAPQAALPPKGGAARRTWRWCRPRWSCGRPSSMPSGLGSTASWQRSPTSLPSGSSRSCASRGSMVGTRR